MTRPEPLCAGLIGYGIGKVYADALGRDAQMSLSLRYCPAIQYARVLLQGGQLGDIYSFRLSYYCSSYRDPQKPLCWKAEMAKSGGGVLSDHVPHLADLLTWLVGMPERVAAFQFPDFPARLDFASHHLSRGRLRPVH